MPSWREENITASGAQGVGSIATGFGIAAAGAFNPISVGVGLYVAATGIYDAITGYGKRKKRRKIYKRLKGLGAKDYEDTQRGLALNAALAKRAVRGGQQGIGGGHDIRGVSIQKDPATGMAVEGAGPASSVAGIAQGRQQTVARLKREQAERDYERFRLRLRLEKKSKSGMRGVYSNLGLQAAQLLLASDYQGDQSAGVTVPWQGPQPKYTGESAWTPSYQP